MTPNKKNVILHIGTHKTGTTSIQLYLYKNQTILERNKILYPPIGCPDFARFGQHLLAWTCFEREDYLPMYKGNKLTAFELRALNLWDQLDKLLATDDSSQVVISSEEFSVLGEAGIECVHQKLSGHNVVVVMYLRRQDEFLESAYGTSVIYNADTRNFYDFSKNQRTNLNYFEMVSLWDKYFGTNNLVVRSYENIAIRKNVVNDFLHVSGLWFEGMPKFEDIRANVSISAHLVEVIRGLRLRGWTQKKLDDLQKVAASVQREGIPSVKTSFMNDEYRKSLRAQFELSNLNLRDKYGCDVTIGEARTGMDNTSVVTDFCDSFVKVISELQDRGGFVEA